jgi:hypothetical protein
MRSRAPWGFVALAALVVLTASACGGRSGAASATTANTAQPLPTTAAVPRPTRPLSKHAYELKMQALGRQLARELYAVGSRAVSTPEVDAGALEDAIPKLRAAARSLARIVPPRRVRTQHELLLRAVLEFADELSGPIARLRSGDLQGFGDIYSLQGARAMEAASKNIEKMGYRIVVNR